MNRKHVSKVGKYISMACLLFVCAMVQSCRDEYFYDDREPDFLGASIYDYLSDPQNGEFTHFLKIIDDLGYKEVLQKTGSKTLFVADDAAFMKGIEREWGIKDTAQLTPAHKRLILYSAMLDNAYLLEMLSKKQSEGEPTPGQCLRRTTSSSVTDSVPLFAFEALPKNNPDWEIFRGGRIRLALDATQSMMTHFIQDQLAMKGITERDLQLVVGDPTASYSDIFIFDKKVIKDKSDQACKNGYVHQLDGLLIPPSNMAEMLRLNGDLKLLNNLNVESVIASAKYDSTTQIFSRILDRFAVPVPIDEESEIAKSYNRLYNNGKDPEQLYEKRYYADQGRAGAFTSYVDATPEKNKHDALGTLRFDPGWNSYAEGGANADMNMAAILAPSDRAIVNYFTVGAGKNLVAQYGNGLTANATVKDLVQAIDSIPLNVIQALANNLLQGSFNNTVPSKFALIMDDARDEMKVSEDNLVKTMMANNGVVYVMDTLYSPARYVSVIAPLLMNDSLRIFNKFVEDEGYGSYLLSMQNDFTVVATSDTSMIYYNPYSERYAEAGKKLEADKFKATISSEGNLSVVSRSCTYTKETYDTLTNTYADFTIGKDKTLPTYLRKAILEYNILLGNVNAKQDRDDRRKYYMSKGYGTVMVERDAEGMVNAIAGGRERQNGAMIPVSNSYEQKNGYALQLGSSMIQPPTQSVYDVLGGNEEFIEFFELCTSIDPDVMKMLLGAETSKNEWDKYRIFDKKENLVRMFNTYHYTVYVPTNAAMEEAYEKGLPTWEDLLVECDSINKVQNQALKDSLKANLKAGADLIINFLRYHFQDNSVYVDNPRHALATDIGDTDGDGKRNYSYDYKVFYETSSQDEITKQFNSVLVQSAEHNGKQTIAVRGDFGESEELALDACANVCYVVNADPTSENKHYNVMTRDIQFNGTSGDVATSSYAVVHQIDGFLVYGGTNGIYDAEEGQFVRRVNLSKNEDK